MTGVPAVSSVVKAAVRAVAQAAALTLAGVAFSQAQAQLTPTAHPSACKGTVYLTFDTGHMGVAELVEQVLARQQVKATFFLADEPTLTGGSSLDAQWAPWWRRMAQAGHRFGSHTLHHDYWKADLPGGRLRIQASAGPMAGQGQDWSVADYCRSLDGVRDRFKAMTGQALLPLFRAPGGKTSAALLAAGKTCGYDHVPWTANGFLGDELSSERFPNAKLLQQSVARVRDGEIMLAHLGIRSRQDPWAPAVLEPLVSGLKAKGYCFATIDQHPRYQAWLQSRAARR